LIDYCTQKPVKTAFLEMLSEAGALDSLTSWLAVRNRFSNDPRFQAALRMSSRHAMIWFNEFASKQQAEVELPLRLTGLLLVISDVYHAGFAWRQGSVHFTSGLLLSAKQYLVVGGGGA